ncbi:MAG: phosphoenolpyruvate--protein phosphotransferase [Lachnospiraceae bacterium]|nr:phosphoenolpyruvate--protein phosphotransferase [Lachnospiraceae bacterium]
MQQIKGIGISGGIAAGRIFFYDRPGLYAERRSVKDVQKETERFGKALGTAKDQIRELYERSLKELGEKDASVFDVHLMMLEDAGFNDFIINMIKNELVCAEYAVYTAGQDYSERLYESGDEYIKARAEDMTDITLRLLQILRGESVFVKPDKPVIFMAEEITASDTAGMDKEMILGFVSRKGSAYSHAAIFSRGMNIPAISGISPDRSFDGKMAILDGDSGLLTLEPDDAFLKAVEKKLMEDKEKAGGQKDIQYGLSATKSGRRIPLLANISSPEDAAFALERGAEGIGLFRSEFLFLNRSSLPSEEEQFNAYKAVAEKMEGRPVVIRTIDLGSDKRAACIKLDKETDPALGYRALRICFDRPDIFRTQLKAICRASAYGEVSVLFPMIVSVNDLIKCREYTKEVMAELKKEGTAFSEKLKIGAMIETPAAALVSDELAAMADFFSIGSNDLTQYTLAADRNNEKLGSIYDPHHPAVLKLIEMSIENAHKYGRKVCICGELAADTSFTSGLLQMGADELSVSLSSLTAVRSKIASAD